MGKRTAYKWLKIGREEKPRRERGSLFRYLRREETRGSLGLLFKVLQASEGELLESLRLFGKIRAGARSSLLRKPGPVLLEAHVDTVFSKVPERIFFDREEGVLWSPEGLGADDRVGVFLILTLLREGFTFPALFCAGEESGGLGAYEAIPALAREEKPFALLGLDRQGRDEAVYYTCGSQSLRLYLQRFGFREKTGSFSDVKILGEALDRASANLSVGFYNQHDASEYLVLRDAFHTLNKLRAILRNPPKQPLPFQKKQTWKEYEGWESVFFRGAWEKREKKGSVTCGICGREVSTGSAVFLCGKCGGFTGAETQPLFSCALCGTISSYGWALCPFCASLFVERNT